MATALVPMLVGMLWYSKMAFGTSWMNINGFTDEDLKKGNMLVIMGLSYVFSFFVAFSLRTLLQKQFSLHFQCEPYAKTVFVAFSFRILKQKLFSLRLQ